MLLKPHFRMLLSVLLITLILPQPLVAQAAPDVPEGVSFAWSATWGDAPQAGFGDPTGIDVGPDGNIYISDATRNDVQVFTPSGQPVRRFGSAGSDAGQFREPADVALRGDKLYVADYTNARVQVLTLAGAPLLQIDGRQPLAGAASVRLPVQVGADGAGHVFLLNESDDLLVRYSAAGAFERRYDSVCRQYPAPHSLAVLSTGVAFCPAMPWGGVQVMPLVGSGTNVGGGSATVMEYGVLSNVAAAPDDTVWAYRASGEAGYRPQQPAFLHLGADGSLLSQFDTTGDVVDIASSADRIFALTGAGRVRVYRWDGQVVGDWGADAFAGRNSYQQPDRLAAAPDGTFYVLERGRKRIRHVNANGEVLAVLTPNAGQGNLAKPVDMAVDALGRLYVLDQEYSPRVVRFANDRFDTVLSVLGTSPYMSQPKAISVTGDRIAAIGQSSGAGLTVYRMDLRGQRIGQAVVAETAYEPLSSVDAALGTNDHLFALNAEGAPAVSGVDFGGHRFASWGKNTKTVESGAFVLPAGIAADLRGRIFVVDTELGPLVNPPLHSSRVQVFDENGAFLTQFGGYGSGQAQFVNPQGVAALSDGRVVVADTNNNRLQVFTPSGDLPAPQPLPGPQTYAGDGLAGSVSWHDLGPRAIGAFSDILVPPQPSTGRPIVGVYTNNALALSTGGLVWQRQGGSAPLGERLAYAGSGTLISSGPYADSAYRSDDLGRTWVRLGDLPPNGPRFLAASPAYDQDHTLFLAAYGGGLWRSTDAGATWELRSGEGLTFYDLVMLPAAGGRALLASATTGVLRSTDDGATWQVVHATSAAWKSFVSPTFEQDGTVFATDGYIQGNGLHRSTDGGLTWTLVAADTGYRWRYVSFSPGYAADKTVLVWFGGNPFSFISADGGNTWTQFDGSGGPSVRWLAFAPSYDTDGAVWRQRFDVPMGIEVTRDGGATWQPLSTTPGMTVHTLSPATDITGAPWAATPYGLIDWEEDGSPRLLYTFAYGWGGRIGLARSPAFPADGTAIGEGVITRDGGETWQNLPFASALRQALGSQQSTEAVTFSPHYAEDGLVLVAYDDEPSDATSELRRSTDSGATWQNLKLPVAAVRKIVFQPGMAADRVIYAAGESGVAISTDGGATWTRATEPLALLKATGLATRLEGGSPVVYAATSSAGIWRSADRGQTWTKFNDRLGDGYLCALDGNDLLLAAVTCAGQVYLWEGAGWQQAGAPVSGRVNDVLVQRTPGAGQVMVGTSTGAFSFGLPLGDLARTWLPLTQRQH